MCGIVLTTASKVYTRTSEMLAQVAHRGPDGKGYTFNGVVGLGHARLAIVDTHTSDSKQPFEKVSQYAIAFNGEIFNYKELGQGTEVQLLGSLMQDQHDLTQLLNGYYAVVFHDISRDQVVLARDLYGVMPLYYSYSNGVFEAASEKHPLRGRIHEVPANSKVTFDLRTRKIKTKSFSQPFTITRDPTNALLGHLFLDAVKSVATHSDSGFSVAFSGGLDSSMVLCALHKLGLEPKEIFTVYAQQLDTQEVDRARRLCQDLGWAHLHHVTAVADLSDLRYWIESEPNPIRDFAFRRHATIAKLSTTKVILCGEGADELGLGYPMEDRHLANPVSAYLKKVSLLKSQSSMTLDRVNKAGMMHGKEYRVPFLDKDFSLAALGVPQVKKSAFKYMAQYWLGVPEYIIDASKYSAEEAIGWL